jgi:hypothetical protein
MRRRTSKQFTLEDFDLFYANSVLNILSCFTGDTSSLHQAWESDSVRFHSRKTSALFCCSSPVPRHYPSQPLHGLSTTSPLPRHNLSTTSPQPLHYLATTSPQPRHHLSTTSPPPRHHLFPPSPKAFTSVQGAVIDSS